MVKLTVLVPDRTISPIKGIYLYLVPRLQPGNGNCRGSASRNVNGGKASSAAFLAGDKERTNGIVFN